MPPPPYSPGQTSRNSEGGGGGGSSSGYGSVRDSIEQQQHGLLAPSSPRNVNQADAPPPKRNWNTRKILYRII